MTGGKPVGLRRRKYIVHLVLLCVALVIETVTAQGGERLLSDAFGTVVAFAIWFVVFERPRERATMAAVLVAALSDQVGSPLRHSEPRSRAFAREQTMLMVLLLGAVYVILRDVLRMPANGAENVLGAICGYIIAGDAWGRINATAYLLVPSAYSINPEVAALLPDWHGRVALFTYYAFTQVLTIGYSDVTPVRAPVDGVRAARRKQLFFRNHAVGRQSERHLRKQRLSQTGRTRPHRIADNAFFLGVFLAIGTAWILLITK